MKTYICESCGWTLVDETEPPRCDDCGDVEFSVVPDRVRRPAPVVNAAREEGQ